MSALSNKKKRVRHNRKKEISRSEKTAPKRDKVVIEYGVDEAQEPSFTVVEKKSKPAKVRKRKRRVNRLQVFANKYGVTRLYIDGKNAYKALPSISRECGVRGIVRRSDGVELSIASKHCDKIIALLNNLCYDYKIVKVTGFFPTAARAAGRIGAAMGAIAVLIMLATYPCFVTRVNLHGEHTAQTKEVLSSFGIRAGAFLPEVDCDAVSKALLACDGIAFASVKRSGAHFDIVIKRELDRDDFIDISGASIVANKTAVVTRVIVNGGSAVVKYGDVVQPGDVMIDGYVMFGDEKIPTQARGEVYGKVYYRHSEYFADTVLEKTYGSIKRMSKLAFFGKVPKAPDSPFESCEISLTKTAYGFILPYEIYTYEFREVTVIERINDLSDEQMSKRAYANALEQIKSPCKVLDKYITIERDGGGTKVTVTVEAEEKIC